MTGQQEQMPPADVELLLAAIDESADPNGRQILCDVCEKPIVIERSDDGKLKAASCECGKFNKTFRGI